MKRNLIFGFIFIIFAVCYAKGENMIEGFWYLHHNQSIKVDGGTFNSQKEQVNPQEQSQKVQEQTELPVVSEEKIEEPKITQKDNPKSESEKEIIKEKPQEQPITATEEISPQPQAKTSGQQSTTESTEEQQPQEKTEEAQIATKNPEIIKEKDLGPVLTITAETLPQSQEEKIQLPEQSQEQETIVTIETIPTVSEKKETTPEISPPVLKKATTKIATKAKPKKEMAAVKKQSHIVVAKKEEFKQSLVTSQDICHEGEDCTFTEFTQKEKKNNYFPKLSFLLLFFGLISMFYGIAVMAKAKPTSKKFKTMVGLFIMFSVLTSSSFAASDSKSISITARVEKVIKLNVDTNIITFKIDSDEMKQKRETEA